ncbi:hypothetical protein [Larkinella punicea]|nr:hypothetical protein [Larkinella punicea]
MKTSAPFFHFCLKTILPVLILLSFSACKNDSDDPQADTATFIGTYTGKMASKGQLAGSSSTVEFDFDPMKVLIKAGSKANEVQLQIDTDLGAFDYWPATVSGNTITLSKQTMKDDFGTTTFEGSGTIAGKALTFTLKQVDDTGTYTHQITATKN